MNHSILNALAHIGEFLRNRVLYDGLKPPRPGQPKTPRVVIYLQDRKFAHEAKRALKHELEARMFASVPDGTPALYYNNLWLEFAGPEDMPEAAVRTAVLEFAQLIRHGDEVHRKWLEEAALAYVDNRDIPPPRDGSGHMELADELEP